MKKYINRNFFWADLFVNQISNYGIKHICISPGSRSTPLTLAFAQNRKFKKFVHVDERSAGFFALGLAKQTGFPTVIVTTSGTAVAELYPAIIEAYIQRIPLIICTADRPESLQNTGANQTINQNNIYANHIRYFADFGLPSLKRNKLKHYVKKIQTGLEISGLIDIGPVHFNFPFIKPLEQNSFTDNISYKMSEFLLNPMKQNYRQKSYNQIIKNTVSLIKKSNKPIIHCGWDNFSPDFYSNLVKFSIKNKIPLFVDGTSELRFIKKNNISIIVNHNAFIENIKKEPDLIIQFGNAPTSQKMLKYINEFKAQRILINQYGDLKDPSVKKGKLFTIDPTDLLLKLNEQTFPNKIKNDWFNQILTIDKQCEFKKNKIINISSFGLEPRIIPEILKLIPDNSNLFISNSLPIRDFDLFASKKQKNIKIYTNRGASGIDGIISTASGIASQSKFNTYLLIGDLAFYHNISALSTINEMNISLTIILINNNGGGIFNSLPIAEESNFEKYFITAQNLEFGKIVKAFGGNYYFSKTWNSFKSFFNKSTFEKSFSVIELKTNPKKSVELRKKYLSKIKESIELNNESHN